MVDVRYKYGDNEGVGRGVGITKRCQSYVI